MDKKDLSIHIFPYLVCLLFVCGNVKGQSVVCRKASIDGFQEIQEKGKQFVGNETSDIKALKLLYATQGQFLFVQSNYVLPGYDFPTKIAISENKDVNNDMILASIIGDEWNEELEKKLGIAKQYATYYIDSSVIKSSFTQIVKSIPKKKNQIIYITIIIRQEQKQEITKSEDSNRLNYFYCIKNPSEGTVNRSFVVEVHVGSDSSFLASKYDSVKCLKISTNDINVEDYVVAKGICPQGDITIKSLIDDIKQSLKENKYADWYFDALPHTSGDHEVQMTLALVNKDGKALLSNIDSRHIYIHQNWFSFFEGNWQFLLTTILIPLISYVWIK